MLPQKGQDAQALTEGLDGAAGLGDHHHAKARRVARRQQQFEAVGIQVVDEDQAWSLAWLDQAAGGGQRLNGLATEGGAACAEHQDIVAAFAQRRGDVAYRRQIVPLIGNGEQRQAPVGFFPDQSLDAWLHGRERRIVARLREAGAFDGLGKAAAAVDCEESCGVTHPANLAGWASRGKRRRVLVST